MSTSKRRSSLTVEDGFIELGGQSERPAWLWARTCPTPDCECVSASVVASRGDRRAFLQAMRTADSMHRNGEGPGDLEAALGEECAAFEVDIYTGELSPLAGDVESMAELEQRHSWLSSVFEAIDGEVLEQLGRLWYRGKGRPNPEDSPQPPSRIAGWMPGEPVSWVEAYFGVRQDFYVVGERTYEAVESYCVMPDCACGEVVVRFDDLEIEDIKSDDVFIGTVTVQPSGERKLESDAGPPELLERLWSLYCRRHPNYRARHAARYPRMRAFGEILVAHHAAKASAPTKKPRPNEPCPCGSGKKYKKCCRLRSTP